MLGLLFKSGCLLLYSTAARLDTIFYTFIPQVPTAHGQNPRPHPTTTSCALQPKAQLIPDPEPCLCLQTPQVPAYVVEPCLTALFTDAVPHTHIGWSTGLLTSTRTLMQVVAPLIFAVLLSRNNAPAAATTPTYSQPWALALASNLVAFLLCVLCLSRRVSPPKEPCACDSTCSCRQPCPLHSCESCPRHHASTLPPSQASASQPCCPRHQAPTSQPCLLHPSQNSPPHTDSAGWLGDGGGGQTRRRGPAQCGVERESERRKGKVELREPLLLHGAGELGSQGLDADDNHLAGASCA
jgi:hypothetical protein